MPQLNERIPVFLYGFADSLFLSVPACPFSFLPSVCRRAFSKLPEKQAVKIGDGGEAAVQGDVQHGFVPFLLQLPGRPERHHLLLLPPLPQRLPG